MHKYGYFGNDSSIFRNKITGGSTEHAVMMFDGIFDIIDDSRIDISNGFTMTEVFSSDENYTPGCVCSTAFSARLLNYDGALTGFNFQRNFTLFLGVENTTSKVTLPSYFQGEAKIAAKIANIWFCIDEDDTVCVMGTNDHEVTSFGGKLTNLITVRNGTNYPLYVYAVSTGKKIVRRFEVSGTSGYYNDDVTMTTMDVSLSDLAYERVAALAERSISDYWQIYTNSIFHYEYQITDGETKLATTSTMFTTVNSFIGEKPKKVLGKIVDFEAQDWNSKLDKDADAYIKTTYSAQKSIITIAQELYAPFGMVPQIQYNSNTDTSLSGVKYATNPFAGLSGYTYRDLVAMLAESIGLNVRFETITLTFTSTTAGFSSVPIPRITYIMGSGYTLGQDEIYDYNTEEYQTTQIQKIIVRQTANDVGVQYPADAAANANTWNIVDNPLLAPYATEQAIRDRTAYIWQRVTNDRSGGFYPGTVECFSQLVLQGGDIFAITDENGDTQTMIISHMTTVWNGMADCTIECVGNEYRNDDASNGYKEKLRNGRKYHDFIVDLESLVSEIGDMEGDINTLQQTATSYGVRISDAEGDISVLEQTAYSYGTRITNAEGDISALEQSVGIIQTEVRSVQGHQIFRGTNKLDTLNQVGTNNNDWQNEKWTRTGAAGQYSLSNLLAPPSVGIKRMVQITASSADNLIMQTDIPLSKTAGVTTQYTVSFWYRLTAGSPSSNNVKVYCQTYDMVEVSSEMLCDEYEWTHVYTVFNVDNRSAKFGIGLIANSNCTIQICGMKLEIGNESTPWSEADSYTLTRITQTAQGIDTEITDALENYYTKSETAQYVNTEMGDALGNYYTKSETSTQINTSLTNALGNYYTKTETASQISTSMSTALGDYYTKTETATQISTAISTNNGNYYTKTETAQQITTTMTTALGNYYTKTETATEISTYVGNHAYGLVSGITINQYGITLSGGMYVSVNAGVSDCCEIKNATSGTINHGISLTSYTDLKLIPRSGTYGGISVSQHNQGLVLLPETSYGNQDSTISQYPAYLGLNLALDGWTESYIADMYYYNAYEQSSREMKEDIHPIDIPGEVIDALNPVSFRYRMDANHQKHYGLIHEDTLPILPDICKGDENTDPEKKAINYIELVAILLKQVQELRARVAALEGGENHD